MRRRSSHSVVSSLVVVVLRTLSYSSLFSRSAASPSHNVVSLRSFVVLLRSMSLDRRLLTLVSDWSLFSRSRSRFFALCRRPVSSRLSLVLRTMSFGLEPDQPEDQSVDQERSCLDYLSS
jgi:hypothetical protein